VTRSGVDQSNVLGLSSQVNGGLMGHKLSYELQSPGETSGNAGSINTPYLN
jgi:hypothetical protein